MQPIQNLASLIYIQFFVFVVKTEWRKDSQGI